MYDLCTAFDDIFAFESCDNQLYFDRVHLVAEPDRRFVDAFAERPDLVRNISELQRGVTVVVRETQGRHEVILRTVGRERFIAGRELGEVRRVMEGRSQIALAKASPVIDTVNEVGLVGMDADQGFFGGVNSCNEQGQEKDQ